MTGQTKSVPTNHPPRGVHGCAADRWRQLQQARAVPPEILEAAEVSPWRHNPARFAAPAEPLNSPSRDAALALLSDDRGDGEPGAVLDVGCGGGSASIAVADRAGELVGIDHDPSMLEVFAADCRARGIRFRTVLGEWPSVADEAGSADAVLCHHVGYNTLDLTSFVVALTTAARRGVVMELTARHPMAWLDPLWARFHDVHRPEPATADDAIAVLAELGITPSVTRWERPSLGPEDPVWIARRLCLPSTRVDEVASALADIPPRPCATVTLAW
ncbi:MAG: methyltransferase domain-containing protein [Pseudonocardia sp.]|nr:methyltransferase domain-containing protein [Pseudonocardia sp.]